MAHRSRTLARWLLGVFFIAAGLNHFLNTAFYTGIMPPWLPWHTPLVWASGVAEIALGALVLWRHHARLAGWGLVALCVAVFPANLHMALNPDLFPRFSAAALWLRLPLQLVLIAWIVWCTRPDHPTRGAP